MEEHVMMQGETLTSTSAITADVPSWPKEALHRRQIRPIEKMCSCKTRSVGQIAIDKATLTLLCQEYFQHDTSTCSVPDSLSFSAHIAGQSRRCIYTVECTEGGNSRDNSDR